MFSAKVLADSVGNGSRLTTLELTFPRIVLAEFNTHRQLSRNAASSRAIPAAKMIEQVKENPFIPIHWGAAQKGMQAYNEVVPDNKPFCQLAWLEARDQAIERAEELLSYGLHKQIVNRLLEPWMWVTVIASATNWSNFFHLRCAPDAEPHIHKIACMARDAVTESSPRELKPLEWHLPLIGFEGDELLPLENRIEVSVGRCARVSYLTHDGRRDVQADLDLHDRLKDSGHWSPFEHAAIYSPLSAGKGGNFGDGWVQYRKLFENECR